MVPEGVEIIDLTSSDSPQAITRSKPKAKIVQKSALLSLPLEVLQTITWHMDAGTFLVSLLTCKQVFKAAKCRPNILRHLHSIPGLRLGLEDLPTKDLLLQFRQRAVQLGCAAGVLADVSIFSQSGLTSLSNAAFSSPNPSRCNVHTQGYAHLATAHDGGIVRVYQLWPQRVRLQEELHVLDGVEVSKMAFCRTSFDLAVLYHASTSADNGLYKLVTFNHSGAFSSSSGYPSHLQETRDIRVSDAGIPVGLAQASNGYACIAWKNPAKGNSIKLMLVERDEKLMLDCNHDEDPNIKIIQDGQDPPTIPFSDFNDRQIFSMEFVENDEKLNFFRPGQPVHSFYTFTRYRDIDGRPPILANKSLLQLDLYSRLSSGAVGMPFYGSHSSPSHPDRPTCSTWYLALSIVNETGQPPQAYIARGCDVVRPGAACNHEVHLDKGRRVTHWDMVAYLAGWWQDTSSLGTVMAISPQGTRIAAAMWSRVMIWSFDPKLLLQDNLQQYFPPQDFNLLKDLGRLRPTILSSEGVVHKMQFIDENNLYATTDRGLVTWDIGHLSKGKRRCLSLKDDAWPDTAVAAPTLGTRKRQKLGN